MTTPKIRMYDAADQSIPADVHRRIKPIIDKLPELEDQIRTAATVKLLDDVWEEPLTMAQILKWNEFGVTDERPS
jgi:uncharacterized protein (UPF0147 family)